MSAKSTADIHNLEHEESPVKAKRVLRVDGAGDVILEPALTIVNAIDQTGFDLNAAAFSETTNLTNDYFFDSVLLNFSTTESKTITITGPDGTILLGGTVDTSSQNLLRNTTKQNFNLIFQQGFDANDNITVDVTQTAGACTMDCILKAQEGSSNLGGNPVLGAGTAVFGTPQEYFHQIALGNIANNEAVTIVAQNDAVGTSEETIWEEGGLYTFPSSASTMTISSSDANDTSAGTGLRTIDIEGLDTNYLEITETVTLNGQTGVTTSNSYLRINRLIGATAGSTNSNEGTIYIGTGSITAGKPANVFNLIETGANISHSGVFTVPASKTFYIPSAIISVESGKFVEITLVVTAQNGIPLQINQWDISGSVVLFNTQITQSIGTKTDIEFRATNSTGGGGDSKVKETFYGILTG